MALLGWLIITNEISETMTQQLVRETTLGGAIILGLGSILGTGAYVSVGLSAELAGPNLVIAIILAAFTALFNSLSSAQLAAVHPVSGGTYEYGYKFLNPTAGLTAGTLFVLAKSASAATAALAVAWYLHGYLNTLVNTPAWTIHGIAAGLLLLFTSFVLSGVRRTNGLNAILVTLSLIGLVVFIVAAYSEPSPPLIFTEASLQQYDNGVFFAAALMFVAFTGYGRIATMGEEVMNPRQTIPKAIVLTLAIISLLYIAVGLAILHVSGAESFAQSNFNIAQLVEHSTWHGVIVLGGIVAMCGVILNLVLGVSRVVLAMGRRGDLPRSLARLDSQQKSAPAATWLTFAVMALIALGGGIEAAWTLSAFTVLVYYGLTNLAALKVQQAQRFVPKWVSFLGLIACLGLAVFIPWPTIVLGTFLVLCVIVLKRITSITNGSP